MCCTDVLVSHVYHSLYRMGEPEDCAGMVSLLCSDDASYITGEIILVAGGMQARL